MDIEHTAEDQSTIITPDAPASALVRAADVLPGMINLLPQDKRPFFPGQTVPMVLASHWATTMERVAETDHKVLGVVLTSREFGSPEEVQTADFFRTGTACRVHRVIRSGEALQVLLEGLQRFRIAEWISPRYPFTARVEYHTEAASGHSTEVKAYAVAIINIIKELLPLNPLYGEELKVFLEHFSPNEPSRLADFAAALITASKDELQGVLETTPILPRLEKVLGLIQKELNVAKAQQQIREHVEEEIHTRQREVFLREQLKAIKKELGIEKDDRTAEADRFRERLDKLVLPDKAAQRIDEELNKLSILETGSPEYAVTRNYLDWLTVLPWGRHSKDALDLKTARAILDKDHEGLDDVKQRIIEFLGVGMMRGEVAGSILLFVGPPGVGKTSLGRSIANALERSFFRFSLGGMRDEAEIKGHRRTYIGAMPGKFIQAIKESETANPVIMLDEIDKIGASFRGDPASALLEVLDPEQNNAFLDHYLDVPFDLSKALFICTANQLDTIPGPLLDRMEMIRLSGYLVEEKVAIASKHLWPRQLSRAGLKRSQVRIHKPAIRKVVEGYAREAGVRQLEKQLGAIVRRAVTDMIDGAESPISVRAQDLEYYLGKPTFRDDQRISGVGVATGLAWTTLGGATLSIEATRVHELARGFSLTGQLGNVMQESANIAYSYVHSNAPGLGIAEGFFDQSTIHLHVPAGATPKDGPSAGITMATALVSLARGKAVPKRLAMTGELTLTGRVLPVGGIREKLIAAKRAGYKWIILPEANRGDFEETPEYVRDKLKVDFVSDYAEVAELVF